MLDSSFKKIKIVFIVAFVLSILSPILGWMYVGNKILHEVQTNQQIILENKNNIETNRQEMLKLSKELKELKNL
jgi:ABC-type long-subunit fatty acid transport system fused permease/ATPase subunit